MTALTHSQKIKAVDAAMRIRKKAKYAATDPVCVFDLAERIGVEVKFIGGNSFGGMYVRGFEKILIPTKRPHGRQAYTCAHELGHWYFDHGTRVELIDVLDKGGDEDPDEKVANIFATNLLMPKWAVNNAIRKRSLQLKSASSLDFYALANQLGVGYETIIKHLHYGLLLIQRTKMEELLRVSPKQIREQIIGPNSSRHLVLADENWEGIPIDLAVGDATVLPADVVCDNRVLQQMGHCESGAYAIAKRPGIEQVHSPSLGWAAYIRVTKTDYMGRSKYRFLEDPDVN